MAVISSSSHALFFNGVSDSVVCPQGDFTKTGHKREVGNKVARSSAPVFKMETVIVLPTRTIKHWTSLLWRLGYLPIVVE